MGCYKGQHEKKAFTKNYVQFNYLESKLRAEDKILAIKMHHVSI